MADRDRTLWQRARAWIGPRPDPLAALLDDVRAAVPQDDPAAALRRAEAAAMAGTLGPARGAALEDALAACGGALVQLGAGSGDAALRLARAARRAEGRLWVVDPSPHACALLEGLLRHAGLGDFVETLPCAPLDAIPSLHRRVDLLLLHHEPDQFLADLRHAERHGRLGPGTRVIACLDAASASDRDAYQAHVRGSGLYESEAREGLEISRCLEEIEAW